MAKKQKEFALQWGKLKITRIGLRRLLIFFVSLTFITLTFVWIIFNLHVVDGKIQIKPSDNLKIDVRKK